MPDTRKHRGAHPEDPRLFGPGAMEKLLLAVGDLSWLLSRGYAVCSAVKMVGDRYELDQRQRSAVMRSACSDQDLLLREGKRIRLEEEVPGRAVWLDGYNVLTTIEVALSGGVILGGRDGCFRDIAGVHGTYRKVEETIPALHLVGEFLRENHVSQVRWYLDTPVSNSGRLKTLILQTAEERRWDWEAELVYSPDGVLARTDEIVASSDSDILNRCGRWVNLAAELISEKVPEAFLIRLA